MRFDIITIFPEIISVYLNESIIKRARERSLLEVYMHNLRDFTHDKHKTVDDRPFGGGPGMVMKVKPIVKAIESICGSRTSAILSVNTEVGLPYIVVLDAAGKRFDAKKAQQISKKYDHVI